ncbi:MAG: hypothetical protein ACT4PV_09375 [Planctomycetaceae bacterium]
MVEATGMRDSHHGTVAALDLPRLRRVAFERLVASGGRDGCSRGARVKILFDQATPVPLRRLLPRYEAHTAYEMGWSALRNDELLRAAQAEGFDAIVTTDKNLRHQQDIARLRLGILVLPTTDWSRIRRNAARAA